MPGLFLTKSRHSTVFHFRRKVPSSLVATIGRSHLVASLQTADKQVAITRARCIAARTDQLFARLRDMDNEDFNPNITKYALTWEQDETGQKRAIAKDIQPGEGPEAAVATALFQAELDKLPPVQVLTAYAVPIPPKRAKATTPVLTEIWEQYKSEKISSLSWKDGEDTAKYDHWPHVRTLIQIIGDKPIGDVTAADINTFLSHVLNAPKGGEPRNRAKRLTRAGALLRWAKTKRFINDDFTELFKYPGRIKDNPYIAFDRNDLKALFESDQYRKNTFTTPSEYWLPLLGLHTGARLNELCQLTVTDIAEHDGVTTISILDDDENKRLKTTASRRIIPIHSNLIRCGLLDYVTTIAEGRIFPELPEDPARPGNFGAQASEWFTDYRRACGVGELKKRSNKAFHSFRSTLISALRKADVPGDRRRRLAGHEATDVHDKNYDGGDALTMFNFETLKADIEKAQFDIDFTPYSAPQPTHGRC